MIDSIPKRSLPETPKLTFPEPFVYQAGNPNVPFLVKNCKPEKAKPPGRLPTGLFRILFKRFSPADWTSNEIYHAYDKQRKTKSFTYQKLVFTLLPPPPES